MGTNIGRARSSDLHSTDATLSRMHKATLNRRGW